MEPLTEYCSPWFALVFVFYMGIMVFAVLNVVTGVFVETAMHTAAEDRRNVLVSEMRHLFSEADTDRTGILTFDKFMSQIETRRMLTILKAMDLDVMEATDLFHLLDTEEVGEIEAETFVNGCQRLIGPAKAVELAALMHEWKRWVEQWSYHAERVEHCLSSGVHKPAMCCQEEFDRQVTLPGDRRSSAPQQEDPCDEQGCGFGNYSVPPDNSQSV